MFTGIIESLGIILKKTSNESNIAFWVKCDFLNEIKIDQSISHNGVCLTVTELNDEGYCVTIIDETLKKTNLSELKIGEFVNLERSMIANGRFDGHIVQGHVDQEGTCELITNAHGSWLYSFSFEKNGNLTVEKGSICVNGVSLTVVNSFDNSFSVAIIPYTFENTNFKNIKIGDKVNLEFDIIGKYLQKLSLINK